MSGEPPGVVESVSRRAAHGVGKDVVEAIALVAGRGVEGDAHLGAAVQHRSRVARDPGQENLRQVHLIHAELHDELAAEGFPGLRAGEMGENVTTRGIDLLALPAGARLRLGDEAVVEVTGTRKPCRQLEDVRPGLMRATIGRGGRGGRRYRAGVMAVVVAGGEVRAGDPVAVEPPAGPRRELEPV